MDCSKFDKIISTPSLGDEARRSALKSLIKDGYLASLYNHALTSSRIDWIRNYSLLALTKFATINTSSYDVAITLQDDEIPLDSTMDLMMLKKKAARLLSMFTSTPNKPRKFKKISLMGLIAGEHWEYCEEILKDSEAEEWVKRTIQSALKTRK
ncbi:MAG: hypothetical protein H7647_00545 [Candidatus Heimdallarchaeota archaeon]|nr:hypothetical protein [Candidatus Heimdallarchaeota archaeon]MCK4252922.1 hypothetical protein [Candidatus Heimdallarchaeota archaeon]